MFIKYRNKLNYEPQIFNKHYLFFFIEQTLSVNCSVKLIKGQLIVKSFCFCSLYLFIYFKSYLTLIG